MICHNVQSKITLHRTCSSALAPRGTPNSDQVCEHTRDVVQRCPLKIARPGYTIVYLFIRKSFRCFII